MKEEINQYFENELKTLKRSSRDINNQMNTYDKYKENDSIEIEKCKNKLVENQNKIIDTYAEKAKLEENYKCATTYKDDVKKIDEEIKVLAKRQAEYQGRLGEISEGHYGFDSEINSTRKELEEINKQLLAKHKERSEVERKGIEGKEYYEDFIKAHDIKLRDDSQLTTEGANSSITKYKTQNEDIKKSLLTLEKRKAEYEKNLDEICNSRYGAEKSPEAQECRTDIDKINDEIEDKNDLMKKNLSEISRNMAFLSKQPEVKQQPKVEQPRTVTQPIVEKKAEVREQPKVLSNAQTVIQPNNNRIVIPQNVRTANEGYSNPNITSNIVSHPLENENLNQKSTMEIERRPGVITIDGESYSENALNINPLLAIKANDRKALSMVKYLNEYGDQTILKTMCQKYYQKLMDSSKNGKSMESVSNDKEYEKLVNSMDKYCNLIKNPKEENEINITYNLGSQLQQLLKVGRESFNGVKDEAYKARNYAEINAGALTKLEWKFNELKNKINQKKLDMPSIADVKDKSKKTLKLGKDKVVGKYQEKTQKLKNLIAKAKEKAIEQKDKSKEKFNTAKDKSINAFNIAKDKSVGTYNTVKDKSVGVYNTAKDKTVGAYNTAKDKTKRTLELGKDKVVGKYHATKQVMKNAAAKTKNKAITQKDKFLDSIIVKATALKSKPKELSNMEATISVDKDNDKDER